MHVPSSTRRLWSAVLAACMHCFEGVSPLDPVDTHTDTHTHTLSLSRPLSLSLSPWQEELDEWTVAFQYAISELPMLGQSAEEFNTH